MNCPYFCRDGRVLVWSINLNPPTTNPCPNCHPQVVETHSPHRGSIPRIVARNC